MRCSTIIFTLTLMLGSGMTASMECEAQQSANMVNAQEFIYEVRGTSTTHPTVDRLWSEPFDTEAKAEARIRELQRDYGKNGLMESAPDKPIKLKVVKRLKAAAEMAKKVKEAKDAVDKAKKIAKEGMSAEERKVGDTLKEYANRVKDAWQNAVNAKKNLTSMTGNITQKQFQNVNKLIDGFNQTRSDFSQKAGASGGPVVSLYSQMARVTPQELKGKMEPEQPAGKWVVWVFKKVDRKWEKQEDQSFSSDDESEARKYLEQAKGRGQEYTATSNLPPPAPDIVGSSWVGESDGFVYTFLADGYSLTAPDGSSYGTMPSKVRRLGNKLVIDGYGNREHTLTIEGDKMYGAPFGGSYLTRKK